MIAVSKITRKNQTTVPRVVLNALGLKPPDRIVYEIEADRVVLHPKSGVLADLNGKFRHFGSKKKYPVSVEDMHAAVMSAVAEKHDAFGGKRKRGRKKG